jgi:hypothetical protein
MSNLYWTTKTGVVMNVDDMDDNHVRNAFKMLLRKIQSRPRPQFKINGDIANMMIDDAIYEEMMDDNELIGEL